MKINIKKLLDKTFWKFILVGIINTLFGSAVMFGFYNLLHCSYWLSSFANYFLGSILSYFLNKYFTFKYKEKGIIPILKFALNIAICYLIAYGIAKPVTAYILSGAKQVIQENIAMLIGMGLFIVVNYIGQRFFVFTKKQKTKSNDNVSQEQASEFNQQEENKEDHQNNQ